MAYRRKEYGKSKIDSCPFCGKRATAVNSQGVPVCQKHKYSELKDLKCVCGEWLDLKTGKFGPYFHCMNCGNINFRKGLDMNPNLSENKNYKQNNIEKNKYKKKTSNNYANKNMHKEITISSKDIGIYY